MKKFILISIIFLSISIIGAWLDIKLMTHDLYSIISKLLIIGVCILVICRKKINIGKGKFFTKYTVIATLPLIVNFVLMYGQIDKKVPLCLVIIKTFRVITTAVWEELHFRAIGVSMLKNKKEKLEKEYAILLVFIFAFLHLINILLNYNNILVELYRTVLAVATGSFFLALYLKTNNIFVPIFSHFLLNYTTTFFNMFSSAPNHVGIAIYNTVYYVGIILYFLISVHIIRRNNLIE